MKIVERVKEHHINVIMKTGIYLKIFIEHLLYVGYWADY